MKEKLYVNYYATHGYTAKEVNYEKSKIFFEYNYNNIFNNLSKDIRILEIGSGQGKFAYYLKSKGFKNYIGLDLDEDIVKETKDKFNDYNFFNISALDYLKDKIEEFDIIYISHVFEHFSLEDGIELSKLINKAIKKGGLWINEMPNAQSIYYASYGRYNDITHKIIYTPNSFNQILLRTGFKRKDIIHKNEYIGTTIIRRVIFNIGYLFHKIWMLSIGVSLKEPHTFNLISIIRKNG